MPNNKKSKNYAIAKLYKVLDFNSKKDLHPENEKYYGSLSQRLKDISGEEVILIKKLNKEEQKDSADLLKPKVIVHAREVKKEPIVVIPEIKIQEKKEKQIWDDDVFEIKKIKIKEPEFIEVKPKTSTKEEIIEIKELKAEKEKLPEWDSLELHKKEEELDELPELEPISEEEIKKIEPEPIVKLKEEKKEIEETGNFCPECGAKLDLSMEFCSNCGKNIKDEEIPSFLPIESFEQESIPSKMEPIEIEKPEEEKISFIEKKEKITIFKDLKSIDDKTTAILFDNGITSIDLLKKQTINDLTKIEGIKKKNAKKIIKELKKRDKKLDNKKSPEIEVFEKEDLSEDQKIEEKGEWLEPEKIDTKPAVWEPIEDEIKEPIKKETVVFEEFCPEKDTEKTLIDEEIKLEVFKDIKSIDRKTAILLYDNGFSNIDTLFEAPIKDLVKIEGVKRKTAKKIKKELNKIKTTPIIIPTEEKKEESETDNFQKIREELETAKKDLKTINKDLTKKEKNIQKLQEELDEKVNDLETKKTELYNKDEEIKVLQEQSDQSKQQKDVATQELTKKEEEIEKLQKELEEKKFNIESKINEIDNKDEEIKKLKEQLDFREKEIKINTFKDIICIDDQTAILLYDNGVTSINLLKNTPKKSIIKIKGIKRKTVKQIIKELDEKTDKEDLKKSEPEIKKEPEEIIEEDKGLEKKEITKGKKKRPIDYSGDENGITKDEAQEIDKKIVDEFSLTNQDDDVFKDISSIDGKISRLLVENGITTIDELKSATIKDLTKIKGIKRKNAKKIKKEVGNLLDKNVESSKDLEEPLEREEAEWEYYDEHLISESTMKEYKGFRFEDYTLYKKEIETKSGSKRTVRFFSKAEPENAEPIDMPKGYEVRKNKKTGLPYLRKKK